MPGCGCGIVENGYGMRRTTYACVVISMTVLGACSDSSGPSSLSDASSGDANVGVADQTTTERRTQLGPISAGRAFTCVVDLEGAVRCWGQDVADWGDGAERHNRPPWLRTIGRSSGAVDVSTDYGETCVVYDDGELWCASASRPPVELARVETVENVVDVAGRFALTAAGRLLNLSFGVDFPPPEMTTSFDAVAIANGAWHTCALAEDSAVWCWGQGGNGQLGDGTKEDHSTPVQVVSDERFVAVGAGYDGSCAIADDGRVWCWGGVNGATRPFRVAGIADAVHVGVGSGSACAIVEGGSTFCWTRDDPTPVALPVGPSVAIDLSGDHGCVVGRDHTISCWGDNDTGQTGAPAPLPDGSVAEVDLEQVTSVTAADANACATTSDGAVWCWGHDFGAGPTRLDAFSDAVEVQLGHQAGHDTGCVLDASQTLWCWGVVEFGQVPIDEPIALHEGSVESFSVGRGYTCARLTSGEVHCYRRTTPCAVQGEFTFDAPTEVVTGHNFACTRTSAGAVQCWGANPVVDDQACTTPQTVSTLDGATMLSAGYERICALVADGVTCLNGGRGFTEGSYRTVATSGEVRDTIYGQITDGETTCASRTEDGTLECWGPLEAPAADLDSVEQIALGQGFGCVLRDDARITCWGRNSADQLGDDAPRHVETPYTFSLNE